MHNKKISKNIFFQNPPKMKPRLQTLILVLLPLLSRGLAQGRGACDKALQAKYCEADYGGDMHTACRFCGIGPQCPKVQPTGRGLTDPNLKREIINRHNDYREQVRNMKSMKRKSRCIPDLR